VPDLDGILRRLQGEALAQLRGIRTDAPFALIDFPDHANVGDSAIWLGQVAFLREHRNAAPRYVASIPAFSEEELRAALPEGPILIHGGGNFGDLWPLHQEFRERILERFPEREIVQLPQSVHFQARDRLERAARAIARHGKFRLYVRDQPSYELATAHFDCEVRLCPDSAVFLGRLDRPRAPEVDVLYLLRTDLERTPAMAVGAPSYRWRVADWLVESRLSIRLHKLLGLARGWRQGGHTWNTTRVARYHTVARARMLRGCRLLSSGRVVITDRLHAHLLCLELGIPHAVLDNTYGKLGRFLDAWTGEAPGVYRAGSMTEAERWAAAVLSSGGRSK
jgi:exopolysaccharide biosynthesis protein PssK